VSFPAGSRGPAGAAGRRSYLPVSAIQSGGRPAAWPRCASCGIVTPGTCIPPVTGSSSGRRALTQVCRGRPGSNVLSGGAVVDNGAIVQEVSVRWSLGNRTAAAEQGVRLGDIVLRNRLVTSSSLLGYGVATRRSTHEARSRCWCRLTVRAVTTRTVTVEPREGHFTTTGTIGRCASAPACSSAYGRVTLAVARNAVEQPGSSRSVQSSRVVQWPSRGSTVTCGGHRAEAVRAASTSRSGSCVERRVPPRSEQAGRGDQPVAQHDVPRAGHLLRRPDVYRATTHADLPERSAPLSTTAPRESTRCSRGVATNLRYAPPSGVLR